jgi:hypothetical protein
LGGWLRLLLERNARYDHSLATHWNGSAWSIVSRAKNAPANTLLEGVSALSPNDAWAVGKAAYPNNQAVFEHWNGKKWTASVEDDPSQLESSNNATANELLGVIAIEGEVCGRSAMVPIRRRVARKR